MKVYVLEEGYAYEGFEILGIYTNKKIAEKVKASLPKLTSSHAYRTIEECELVEE